MGYCVPEHRTWRNRAMNKLLILCICLTATGCSLLFPRTAGDELAHFEHQALALGSQVPNLTFTNLAGEPVALRSLLDGRPLVVQLGSYSCPVFRYRRFDMEPIHRKFANQVAFVVLYTQEAHPAGTPSPYRPDSDKDWVPLVNRLARVDVTANRTLEERLQRANSSQHAMYSEALYLVDDMQNSGWRTFGQAPSAAFVFDREGHLVTRQVWVQPREIERKLEGLVGDDR